MNDLFGNIKDYNITEIRDRCGIQYPEHMWTRVYGGTAILRSMLFLAAEAFEMKKHPWWKL
jgi:hypothetical protein